jgi:Icc protein
VPATILQLSDTHLRGDGGLAQGLPPGSRLAATVAAWVATGQRCDLILLTGDITDDASPAACRTVRELLMPLDAPVLALPGNHDDAAVVGAELGFAGHAEVGAWRVVTVDSSIPGQIAGAVDATEVATRLDRLDTRPTLLAIHHPPRSRSTHPWFQLAGADPLLAALANRPHVRAIAAGHLHDAVELRPERGPVVVGCPSTLVTIVHDGDDHRIAPELPVGARVWHLADDGTFATSLVDA